MQALGTRRKDALWGRGHPGNQQGQDKDHLSTRAKGCLALDLTDFSALRQCFDHSNWGCVWP